MKQRVIPEKAFGPRNTLKTLTKSECQANIHITFEDQINRMYRISRIKPKNRFSG
jgi:hypothetical protein